MRQVIHTNNAPKAIGPYSQAIKTDNFLFLSGQLGLDPVTNDFIAGNVAEQTRQSLTNLKNVVETAGGKMANVVKTTVFLKDMADFPVMNGVYAEFFPENPPSRSTVQAAALPKGGLIEIEAIVILD
jgi:2-iminobutanoate/2-iminopropanoate deaminase